MGSRILVVEDNRTNLDLMNYLLKALGHEVVAAESGAEALSVADGGSFDLVLLDVHMPVLDGYEVLGELKKLQEFLFTPVVAVTALAMVGDREKLLASGFDGYISKPIEPEGFAEQVNVFLRLSGHPLQKPR